MKLNRIFLLTVATLLGIVGAYAQETTEKVKSVISREDVKVEVRPGVSRIMDASTSPTTSAVVPPTALVNRVTEIVCMKDDDSWSHYYITVRPIEGQENTYRIVGLDGVDGQERVFDFSKDIDPQDSQRKHEINASWCFCQIGFQLRFDYDEEEKRIVAEGKTPPIYVGPSDMLYRYVEPQESNPHFAHGVLNVNPLGEYLYGIAIWDFIDGKYVKKTLKETEVSKFVEYVNLKKNQKIPWDDLNKMWAQQDAFNEMPVRYDNFGVMMDYWHDGAYHIYYGNYDDYWYDNQYYSDSRNRPSTDNVKVTKSRNRYRGGSNTPRGVKVRHR